MLALSTSGAGAPRHHADTVALYLATSLLDHDELVALLRRKPLLAEFDPAAHQAILDAIKEAKKAKPRERGKRRTALLYKRFASDVNFLMTHDPAFSGKDKKDAIGYVANYHGVIVRTVERACEEHGVLVRKGKPTKER